MLRQTASWRRSLGEVLGFLKRPCPHLGLHLLCLGLAMACSGTRARATPARSARVCPPGSYDYGSGMVAATLPTQLTAALERAHEQAYLAAGGQVSSFLADQPWRPHVSVIYGVTQERAPTALRALQAFAEQHVPEQACFGTLQYWDDDVGGKTTLVLSVEDADGLLASLHETLAQKANISSRFVYHPHVTLVFLQPHTRFGAAQEAAIGEHLRGVCWRNTSFFLTNPCGQELYRATLPLSR